jgi:hypothetical protein
MRHEKGFEALKEPGFEGSRILGFKYFKKKIFLGPFNPWTLDPLM